MNYHNWSKINSLVFTMRCQREKQSDGMANSVDPDQTALSDQGLHLLFRAFCPCTWSSSGISITNTSSYSEFMIIVLFH